MYQIHLMMDEHFISFLNTEQPLLHFSFKPELFQAQIFCYLKNNISN